MNTNTDLKLTPIVAPLLSATEYGANVRKLFENINRNFEILANRDFVKGEQGESIRIELISLGKTYEDVQLEKLRLLLLNRIEIAIKGQHDDLELEPIYYIEKLDDEKAKVLNWNDNLISEDSIFYIIYKNNNIISSLAYITLDKRFNDGFGKHYVKPPIKNKNYILIDESEAYKNKTDISCSIYLKLNLDESDWEVVLANNCPTLYYDTDIKDFCWHYLGVDTKIPARGPKGNDAENVQNMFLVQVDGQTSMVTREVLNIMTPEGNWSPVDDYNKLYKVNGWPEINKGSTAVIFEKNANGINNKYWISIITIELAEDKYLYKVVCANATSINNLFDENSFLAIMKRISPLNNIKGYFMPFKPTLLTLAVEDKELGGHCIFSSKPSTSIAEFNDLNIASLKNYNSIGAKSTEELLKTDLKTDSLIYIWNNAIFKSSVNISNNLSVSNDLSIINDTLSVKKEENIPFINLNKYTRLYGINYAGLDNSETYNPYTIKWPANTLQKFLLYGGAVVGKPYGNTFNPLNRGEIFNDYENNIASGEYSHAEGYSTTANGIHAHVEGYNTTAKGIDSHAEGEHTLARADRSHTEGYNTIANGINSHAEGDQTISNGKSSHAEGSHTTTDKDIEGAHAEGKYNHSTGFISTIGVGTGQINKNALAVTPEGKLYINGIGGYMGFSTTNSIDLANSLIGKPLLKTLNVNPAHSEIFNDYENNKALGNYSHAEGRGTCTDKDIEGAHAEGKYNYSTGFISTIGVGTSKSNKNALAVTPEGNIYVNGIGNYNGTNIQSTGPNYTNSLLLAINSLTEYVNINDKVVIKEIVENVKIINEILPEPLKKDQTIKYVYDKTSNLILVELTTTIGMSESEPIITYYSLRKGVTFLGLILTGRIYIYNNILYLGSENKLQKLNFIQTATDSEVGGIKLGYVPSSTDINKFPVQLSEENEAYVDVSEMSFKNISLVNQASSTPGANLRPKYENIITPDGISLTMTYPNMSLSLKAENLNITSSKITINGDEVLTVNNMPEATQKHIGGFKTGFVLTGNNYPVSLDGSGKAYVNVPSSGGGGSVDRREELIENIDNLFGPERGPISIMSDPLYLGQLHVFRSESSDVIESSQMFITCVPLTPDGQLNLDLIGLTDSWNLHIIKRTYAEDIPGSGKWGKWEEISHPAPAPAA